MNKASMTIGEFGVVGKQAQAIKRPSSRSWKRIIIGSSIGLLVVGGLVALGYWLLTSPTFLVKRVESGSFRFTANADVDLALTECLNTNIWTLSTTEIAEHLHVLPWVRDLRVSRRLPDTICVDFREWRPLLAVAAQAPSGALSDEFVMLENGTVLPFPTHLTMPGLPVLVGVDLETTETANIWQISPTKKATVLALVKAIESTGIEAIHPIDFLVAEPSGFVVVLQQAGGRLLLGWQDYYDRINRYLVAAERVPSNVDIDLRFQDRLSFPSDARSEDHLANTIDTRQERP